MPPDVQKSLSDARLAQVKGNFALAGQNKNQFGTDVPLSASELETLKKDPTYAGYDISPTGIVSKASTSFSDRFAGPTGVGSSTSVRDTLNKTGESPETIKNKTQEQFENFKKQFELSSTQKPSSTFNRVSEFNKLRDEAGLASLENEVNGYEAEKKALEDEFRKYRASELKGPGTQGFASGRISEAERALMERSDFVNRNLEIAQNKLNTKNKFIQTMIDLGEKDYQTARDDYEFEYNKNLQLISAFNNYTNAEEAKVNRERDDARATWQTISNALASGNVNYADIPLATKQEIVKLEQTMGLPLGFTEHIKNEDPKANIISTDTFTDTNGNRVISVLKKVGNEFKVEKYIAGKAQKESTVKDMEREADKQIQSIIQRLETQAKGDDNLYDPEKYAKVRQLLIDSNKEADASALDKKVADKFSEGSRQYLRQKYGIVLPE